jgi:carnosine N-methyltransferase
MNDRVVDRLTCPRCAGGLNARAPELVCARCGQVYPRVGPIPVLLPHPTAQVDLWRKQLAFVVAQGQRTLEHLQTEAARAPLLPDTSRRLNALARGVRDQADDLLGVLGPALGGEWPGPDEIESLPAGARSPLQYVHYLYRDWGWEGGNHPENHGSLEAIREVVGATPLGRMLVLGAGGCRLASDLHRQLGGTETAVLDIDPLLLVIAEAVLRGRAIRLTESTVNIQETARVAEAWTLSSRAGPIAERDFHFFFADGLAPPFREGTFDTVVTPWFIDQVPEDLPSLIDLIAGCLRPGGRWLNHGPLIYPSDAPLARRFSREEIFDLAARSGFEVSRWGAQSRPYLVSPISGRGRVEWILTFEARLRRG